jgi:hypothetical protein
LKITAWIFHLETRPLKKYSFLFKFKPPAGRIYTPEGKAKILTIGKEKRI